MNQAAPQTTQLKRILVSEGRKARWLAHAIGVHETQVSRWINGHGYPPGEENRRKIAETLGRTINEVFPTPDRPVSGKRFAA